MKKISSYLPSLILSVLLVFALLGGSVLLVTKLNVTPEKAVELAEEEQLQDKVYSELEKYYKSRYYTTGIPAEVYMDEIGTDWLKEQVEVRINDGFKGLEGSNDKSPELKNETLEESITGFFSSYADSIGYEKDEAYEKKVDTAVSSAYKVIGSSCDVYKFSALSEHGVLSKLGKVYRLLDKGVIAAGAAAAVLLLLLLLVNLSDKSAVLYWTGISAIIAGVLGGVPCAYLIATRYFSSFSIKQSQIYTAYTSAMYSYTSAVMATMIAVTVIGIALVILYGAVWSLRKQKGNSAPLPEQKKVN